MMILFRSATGLATVLLSVSLANAQLFPSLEQRTQNRTQAAPIDRAVPYAPPATTQPETRAVQQQPQSFFPQNFRAAERPAAQGDARTQWQDHRRELEPRALPETRQPVAETRVPAIVQTPFAPPEGRDLASPERRNALVEIRNAPAPLAENRFLDYRIPDRAPFDYRPLDYKPVDARTTDYKSHDNKIPDQRVLDPRLKEKGPEIQTRTDCKAIVYRAVECNFIDYREPDPKLLELAAKYPEINLGIVPREFTREAIDRWTPLVNYLSREIGLKISLKVANDYQALAESQKAGLIHIAIYSPLSFARARIGGSRIEAFAVETNPDGSRGAHAMVYALAKGQNARVEDLKGKTIGLVDPNSMTGFNVPRFALSAQKIDPESFLGRQVFTGSHENALLALSQGLVDLAVGEWKSDEDSTLARLLARGQLRNTDGTPMRRDDFRVVLKSEQLLNSPVAYLADLPEDLKAILRRAMLEAPMRDRAAFERVYEAKGRTWETIDTRAYDSLLDLIRYMDESRKRRQS